MVSPLIFLRELPSDEALRRLLPQYKGNELESIECYLLLLRSVNDMLHPVEKLLSKFKLSRGRLSVLLRLLREHPQHVAVSTLAHDCGVRQATMTGLLGGLINAKLARKKTCSKDKRVSHVNITANGRRLMNVLLPFYFAEIEKLSRHMAPSDRTSLIRLLREYIDSVAGPERHTASAYKHSPRRPNRSTSTGQHKRNTRSKR